MKLVEILAQELEMWPEGALVLSQLENGYICKPGESSFDEPITVAYYDLAEDWSSAVVTRPQWQAERDRMKAMESIELKDTEGLREALKDWEAAGKPMGDWVTITEPTVSYEQELWDRVAAECYAKYTHKTASRQLCTGWAFAAADYFMAERAKRVGK